MKSNVVQKALISVLFGMGSYAFAGETTCKVSGMHCEGCQESVQEKVCSGDQYATCEIKILDKDKKIGEVHLVTKDKSAKVDLVALAASIEDAGYKLETEKCKSSTKGSDSKGKNKSS